MPRPRPLLAALAAACFPLAGATGTAVADPGPTGAQNAMGYYVALGDSLAAGYQPGQGDDKTGGYVAGVLTAIRAGAPKTRLANLACSGETVASMVAGGRCDYREGTQLAAALAFLHAHGAFTRVVTIDIGANDVQRCVIASGIDLDCVDRGLKTVATDLPIVLGKLRAAAPNARLVVLDYYNPFLALWLTGPDGQRLAQTSTLVQRVLTSIITSSAVGSGAVVAGISGAFTSGDWTPVTVPTVGRVPTNVATICRLTWMCTRFDIHANDSGYAVMAAAVAARLR